MKVLVVANNGREHALIWKLSQSPQVSKIFAAPGNGGTAQIADNLPLDPNNFEELIEFAVQEKIDLTIIEQDDLLAAGLVDEFKKAGLAVYGPTKAAARIESSKVFSKDLMRSEGIPTANFQSFDDADQALAYIDAKEYPLVVKASGLALGKGVVICQNAREAESAINAIMVDKVFARAGDSVVIEDFLTGREASIHALTDGENVVIYPPAEDHKQIFDGDKGPNTGGIGVFAPVSWITKSQLQKIEKTIVRPVLAGLMKRGAPFTGHLYPGLMIDGDDINVVEFNARCGDPETEVYMRLLDGDLFEILSGCAKGQLDPRKIAWKDCFAICVTLCSAGYPGKYKKGRPITGLEVAEKMPDIVLFHSGTIKDEAGYKTSGGRVVHVTATGTSLDDARDKAYEAIKLIHFEGMHYRSDIGLRSLR